MERGHRLCGRYEVREVLGRGGMAEVRLADDLHLNRQVAVKTLRSELMGDPLARVRFLREALSAASLNHPGIVAVYDSGEDQADGVRLPYIVMEYVEGRTLADLVSGGPPLTPRRALRLAGAVVEALAHAHRNGIVHRDIKPANVMLCADDVTVKVMDFGIARSLGARDVTLTRTAMVMGTADYLSPEQARGEEVDERTDLYSAGCLLYELLTGLPPFTGEGPLAVAYAHVHHTPEPPSTRVPALPPACDAVVLKALAKAREERYQSAEEMLAGIEETLRRLGTTDAATPAVAVGDPDKPPVVSAPPERGRPGEGGTRPTGRRRSRGRWAAAVSLAALMAVAVVTMHATGRGSAGGGAPAAATSRGTSGGDAPAPATAEVPDLVGKTITEARKGAQTVGLHVVRVGSGICPGRATRRGGALGHHVCGQVPASGSRITRGGSIRVQLSSES